MGAFRAMYVTVSLFDKAWSRSAPDKNVPSRAAATFVSDSFVGTVSGLVSGEDKQREGSRKQPLVTCGRIAITRRTRRAGTFGLWCRPRYSTDGLTVTACAPLGRWNF